MEYSVRVSGAVGGDDWCADLDEVPSAEEVADGSGGGTVYLCYCVEGAGVWV